MPTNDLHLAVHDADVIRPILVNFKRRILILSGKEHCIEYDITLLIEMNLLSPKYDFIFAFCKASV